MKLKSALWDYFGYPKNKWEFVLEDRYLVCKNVDTKEWNTSNICAKSMCPVDNINQQQINIWTFNVDHKILYLHWCMHNNNLII